jgi:hypothetical protein
MNLFIQIENSQPIGHPAFEDNLIQAFGSVPSNWFPFNRVQQPIDLLKTPFQITQVNYVLSSDGLSWEDAWTTVEMSDAEKAELIAKEQAKKPCPNVTLDTNTLEWIKDTPKPTDGKKYRWDWTNGVWNEIT